MQGSDETYKYIDVFHDSNVKNLICDKSVGGRYGDEDNYSRWPDLTYILNNPMGHLVEDELECSYVGDVDRVYRVKKINKKIDDSGLEFNFELTLKDPEQLKYITNAKYSVKYLVNSPW